MIRIYIIAGLCALLLALGWGLRHQIKENALLANQVSQLEVTLAEANDNVQFQMALGNAKDDKADRLRREVKRTADERAAWKGLYDEMLNKPENAQWASQPLPPDVRDSLRRNKRNPPDPVRARSMAEDFIQRLRTAAGASPGQEPGTPRGDQGVGAGAGGLQQPATPRP